MEQKETCTAVVKRASTRAARSRTAAAIAGGIVLCTHHAGGGGEVAVFAKRALHVGGQGGAVRGIGAQLLFEGKDHMRRVLQMSNE